MKNASLTGIEKPAAAAAAVLLLFALAVLAVFMIFNSTRWLYKEYRDELDIERTEGILPADAARVLTRMMHYSTGRANDLDVTITENGKEVPFFNERELSHMRDVRRLTRTILFSGLAAFVISAAVLIALIVKKRRDALRVFAKAYLIALAAALVIVIALAVWVIVDFDSFWTMFHVVFLDLESSTFDPSESRMIRICPAELFADFTGKLGSYAAILTGAAGIACFLFLRKTKKKDV